MGVSTLSKDCKKIEEKKKSVPQQKPFNQSEWYQPQSLWCLHPPYGGALWWHLHFSRCITPTLSRYCQVCVNDYEHGGRGKRNNSMIISPYMLRSSLFVCNNNFEVKKRVTNGRELWHPFATFLGRFRIFFGFWTHKQKTPIFCLCAQRRKFRRCTGEAFALSTSLCSLMMCVPERHTFLFFFQLRASRYHRW